MNYQTSKKKNTGCKKNFKPEKKSFKRDFYKLYKLCKDVKIGLESTYLEMTVMLNLKEKRRNKKKEILSVMMSFLIEPYKIKRRKKIKKSILKKILKLNKRQFKIYGCSKTALSVNKQEKNSYLL